MAQRITGSESEEEVMTPEQRAAVREIQQMGQLIKEKARQNQAESGLVQKREARLQAVRTQETSQIAESALVQLLDEGDAEAHAFQCEQMAVLREELAPPSSPIAERLLAEAVVKARFEALLWSARSDHLLLQRKPPEDSYEQQDLSTQLRTKEKLIRLARNQVLYEERAREAKKRYLNALRELAIIRRLSAPLLKVNLAQATPPSGRSATPALGSPDATTWAASSQIVPAHTCSKSQSPSRLPFNV